MNNISITLFFSILLPCYAKPLLLNIGVVCLLLLAVWMSLFQFAVILSDSVVHIVIWKCAKFCFISLTYCAFSNILKFIDLIALPVYNYFWLQDCKDCRTGREDLTFAGSLKVIFFSFFIFLWSANHLRYGDSCIFSLLFYSIISQYFKDSLLDNVEIWFDSIIMWAGKLLQRQISEMDNGMLILIRCGRCSLIVALYIFSCQWYHFLFSFWTEL